MRDIVEGLIIAYPANFIHVTLYVLELFQRVGKHGGKSHKKKLIKPSQKPVTVFRDPSPPAAREEVAGVGEEEALVTGGQYRTCALSNNT